MNISQLLGITGKDNRCKLVYDEDISDYIVIIEPITPRDAMMCIAERGRDYLVVESFGKSGVKFGIQFGECGYEDKKVILRSGIM